MKIDKKDFESLNSLSDFITSQKIDYGILMPPASKIKIINIETISKEVTSDFPPIGRMTSTYQQEYFRLWYEIKDN